jgi:type III pantothenate kinase
VLRDTSNVHRIAVVSVGGAELDRRFAAEAKRATGVSPEFIASARSGGGITTRYTEPWRLGVDRFAGAVGGYHLTRPNPVCVINAGTAITIDLVDASGVHQGGAIIPGPELMVKSLLRNTNGIQRRTRGGKASGGFFARHTRAAVEQGSLYTAAAIIDRAHVEASRTLAQPPRVLLAGGAADRIRPFLTCEPENAPDIVLRGLGVLIGLELN